ncbi:craniofacial development protein 1 [Triplophysa rosa]|uniref:Craniofacial development protein 1 n=1 Tax=Triplophysa rosa TaxID=992332 RepID=A0A9W7TSI4_TRIRA|nr:craniofacial development protein 1 [Triplophysa rosa]KAI7802460.1 craniofacial development protein 1 [Triplophysa rosa]
MNYSDYDSEDYASNEDDDYVPSDDNLSEDDINECEKEDGLELEEHDGQQSEHVKKKKKNSKGGIPMRKRKKGGLKIEDSEGSAVDQQGNEDETKEESAVRSTQKNEEQQKKKSDDLWASFLSDVGPRPKTAVSPSTDSQQSTSTAKTDQPSEPSTGSEQQGDKPKESTKITITKVFDFAGEEVRVSKEVDINSREAKSFLKTEETSQENSEKQGISSEPMASFGSSVKRPAGMGSILNRIGSKKQKMSTLEKSKMDWDAFKSEEGIADELAIHNRGKEGYVERKNFLERVDHRQFEREKNVRLSNMKQ